MSTELILILVYVSGQHMVHFLSKLNFKCVVDVCRFALEEEEYVEFSKVTQDRIIGTKGEIATVSLIIS